LRCRLYGMHFEFVVKLLGILTEWKTNCDRDRKNIIRDLADHKRKQQQNQVEMSIKKEQVQDILTKQKRDQKKTGGEIRLNMEIRNLDIKQTQLDLLVSDGEQKLIRATEQAREEKRQLLVCIIDILSNMDHELLKEWIQIRKRSHNSSSPLQSPGRRTVVTPTGEAGEIDEDLVRFCLCLQLCVNAFEYRGNDILSRFYDELYEKNQKALIRLQEQQERKMQRTASRKVVKKEDSKRKKDVSMKNFLSEVNQQKMQEPKKGLIGTLTSRLIPGGFNSRRQSVMEKPAQPLQSASQTLSVIGRNNTLAGNSSSNPNLAQTTHVRHQSNMTALDLDRMQYAIDRILHEKAMSVETGFLVFRILTQLVPERVGQHEENDDYDPDSDTEVLSLTPLFENIIRTLLNYLHMNQSDVIHSTVLCYVRYFMRWYHRLLFHSDVDLNTHHRENAPEYGPVLCEALMALCNSHIPLVRTYAAGALYLLIRFNFFINGRAPQVMATLALSRTLNAYQPVANRLHNTIEWMMQTAVLDHERRLKRAQGIGGELATGSVRGVNKFLTSLALDVKRRELEKNAELYGQFVREMEPLCQTLKNLLRDTIAVNETILNRDPHKTEDLFYRISRLYIRIPELQFNWLQQLAQYHKQSQNYPEAAQCYYRIIALAIDQMRNSENEVVLQFLPLERFYALSDDIKPYVADMHKIVSSVRSKSNRGIARSSGVHTSHQFTEHGIVELLNTTIDLLELAEFYEHAIVLLEMLLPIYTRYDDLDKLAETHGRIQTLMQMTAKSLKEKSRLQAVFYRVCLFGFDEDKTKTDESDHVAGTKVDSPPQITADDKPTSKQTEIGFIYKMPKLFKLPKMKKYMKEKYGEDVELIMSTKKINKDDLQLTGEGKKRYAQMSGVKPYIPEEHYDSISNAIMRRQVPADISSPVTSKDDEDQPRLVYLQKTSFEKTSLNIDRFYHEVAFSKTGKKLDPNNIAEVYKKKTIITVRDHFPFVKTRSPIISEQDVILTPIETAIENMMEQVSKLDEVIGAAMASVPTPPSSTGGVSLQSTHDHGLPGAASSIASATSSLVGSFNAKPTDTNVSDMPHQSQTTNIIMGGVNAELVDLQSLQMVLQGSVSAGVNGGPSKIVEAFLKREERYKYKRQHVKFLNERCHQFLNLCEKSLKFHGAWCKTSQKPFHAELEKGFATIKELFAKHLLPLDRNGQTIFTSQSGGSTNRPGKVPKSTSKHEELSALARRESKLGSSSTLSSPTSALSPTTSTSSSPKPRQRFNTLLQSIRVPSNMLPKDVSDTTPITTITNAENTEK
jgi:tetratricopeptide (TPR) repeat protein